MFPGHYGPSFAAKRIDPTIPLWVLFVAVQLLDILWAPFVLLGIEKLRIVPGITATNSLDLYYMPYTHSLVGAIVWSLVAVAVFSHWVLDLLVHRPDLPIYDNTAKVGLGLWNFRVLALGLEAAVLFGGMLLYFGLHPPRRTAVLVFGVIMFLV